MPRARFEAGQTFAEFLETAVANQELWRAVFARTRVPDEMVARVAALPGRWRLLVLLEDWCGDAVNTVPLVARLAMLVPNLELRVVGRDANPDLMDTHLTNGARSIPVVMVFDEDDVEYGWWGPRPAALQQWMMSEGMALPKEDRYREARRWYARDRGLTTLEEVVGLLESAARERATAG